LGEVAEPLKRRETEPVLYPDAFDKFMGGTLRDQLNQFGCRSLVVVGSATNFAVLYTARRQRGFIATTSLFRWMESMPKGGMNMNMRFIS
jgi:nicotinamidase-related amidase